MDYIEPDYINGVKDDYGRVVIRPLTASEKKFLNDFYEEAIISNFEHHPELKRMGKRIREIKLKDKATPEELEEYMNLQMQYYALADEELLYSDEEDQKKIYGENNSRNRCAYNHAKASGVLVDIPVEDVEEEASAYIDPDSGRNIFIDTVEYQRRNAIKARNKKEDDNG